MAGDDESFISHLEALRSTLLKCVICLGIVLPFALFCAPYLLKFFVKYLISDNKITFNYFTPVEVFILQIKLAFVFDIVICFPYIVKKIWNFILPALYENEKKFIKSIVLLSFLLFLCGVLFCLFVIVPFLVKFGLSFSQSNIQPVFNITGIINICLGLSVVFGLMFQIPLIVNALIRWNIVSYASVSEKRPYVVVGLLIFSALLTPPDIISQLLLFLPTYLLFEFGLLFSEKAGKKLE